MEDPEAVQLFKLIFDHDLRLQDLRNPPLDHDPGGASFIGNQTDSPSAAGSAGGRRGESTSATLEDFLRPDPTYSRLYLTGTRLPEERFGLSTLDAFDDILHVLRRALPTGGILQTLRASTTDPGQALATLHAGQAMVAVESGAIPVQEELLRSLSITSGTRPLEHRRLLGDLLAEGHIVIFKEQAHHGFDLHVYSARNLFRDLFPGLRSLTLTPEFRFFSINAKRMRSERMFYFELWTLDSPPHGFEEVFPDSTL